jgi:hypothetical protein
MRLASVSLQDAWERRDLWALNCNEWYCILHMTDTHPGNGVKHGMRDGVGYTHTLAFQVLTSRTS